MARVTAHALLLRLKYECRETAKFSRSRAGVEAIVDGPEPGLEHVRIDLGRRQIRMTEHQLNRAQVRPALQKMCRKRMTQDMRAERRREIRAPAVALQNLPKPDARQTAAPCVEKQPG